jgi:hypothetical protein
MPRTVQKPTAKRLRSVRRISARFMSTHEFADLIGVTARTIQRRTSDRSIDGWPTPIRIGPTITLYERVDVERFLQEARSERPAQPVEATK